MLAAREQHDESLRTTSLPTRRVEPVASMAADRGRPAARNLQGKLPTSLAGRVEWLRAVTAHEPMPTRLHARGIEPDSVLGSPELAPAFRRYINANHEREQRDDGCYVYPLHAALARLANGGSCQPSRPISARVIFEVIRAGFEWQRVADRMKRTHEEFEPFLSEAIRLLYDQYSFRPLN